MPLLRAMVESLAQRERGGLKASSQPQRRDEFPNSDVGFLGVFKPLYKPTPQDTYSITIPFTLLATNGQVRSAVLEIRRAAEAQRTYFHQGDPIFKFRENTRIHCRHCRGAHFLSRYTVLLEERVACDCCTKYLTPPAAYCEYNNCHKKWCSACEDVQSRDRVPRQYMPIMF